MPVQRDCPSGARRQIVDGHTHLVQGRELAVSRSEHFRKAAEDLQFFSSRARFGLPHRVAQGDYGGGLDVERRSAGRFSMHDAIGTMAQIAWHRDDVTAFAKRDATVAAN